MMSDIGFLTSWSIAVCVGSAVLAFVLARKRPGWRKRGVLIPALVPTGPIMAPCAYLVAHAAAADFFWPETCGVDACGMAMVFGVIGLFFAFLLFAFGAAIAFFVRRRALS